MRMRVGMRVRRDDSRSATRKMDRVRVRVQVGAHVSAGLEAVVDEPQVSRGRDHQDGDLVTQGLPYVLSVEGGQVGRWQWVGSEVGFASKGGVSVRGRAGGRAHWGWGKGERPRRDGVRAPRSPELSRCRRFNPNPNPLTP